METEIAKIIIAATELIAATEVVAISKEIVVNEVVKNSAGALGNISIVLTKSGDIAPTITAFAAVITAIAVVWTARIAKRGLSTWKVQHKAINNFDQARRLLRAVEKAKDSLERIRKPHKTAKECEETSGKICGNDSKYPKIFRERWLSETGTFSEFQAALFESKILWGDEIEGIANSFDWCIKEMEYSVIQYSKHYDGHSAASKREIVERKKVLEPELYPNEPDDYWNKVEAVFKKLESFLRKHLDNK